MVEQKNNGIKEVDYTNEQRIRGYQLLIQKMQKGIGCDKKRKKVIRLARENISMYKDIIRYHPSRATVNFYMPEIISNDKKINKKYYEIIKKTI